MLITDLELMDREKISWYYGFAYYILDKNISVFLPIPLNFFVKKIRQVFERLKYPQSGDIVRLETKYQEGYSKGCEEGFLRGWKRFYDMGIAELDKKDKEYLHLLPEGEREIVEILRRLNIQHKGGK